MDEVKKLSEEIEKLKKRIEKLEQRYALDNSSDELLKKAIKFLKDLDKVSASFLQRRLSIGYSRAARILDQLEEKGLVGKAEGSEPRKVFKK